jgi:hypothetical protein
MWSPGKSPSRYGHAPLYDGAIATGEKPSATLAMIAPVTGFMRYKCVDVATQTSLWSTTTKSVGAGNVKRAKTL